VARNELEKTAPLAVQPVRWMACTSVSCYYRIIHRIRAWGALPRRRGPALVVANHQHEIESPIIVSDLAIRSFSWRWPIFTVSSRRMWEPGFFAERIPWLAIARGVNLGKLFSSIGMQPIENELHTRPLVSIAYMLSERHGDLRVETIFRDRVLERFPPEVRTLRDILRPAHFLLSRAPVKLTDVLEPYRAEALQRTRDELETDIAHFENLARDGATIFLTPEGFYSGDGKMQRLRGILARLTPLAKIWLAGVSYDPYAERRLTMLYRVVKARDDLPLEAQLKAVRPVTATALLCTWLAARDGAFTFDEALAALTSKRDELPAIAFIVQELRTNSDTVLRSVLENMVRLGTLRAQAGRYRLTDARRHPQFPRTTDMIAYQYNFHTETLEGLAALARATATA
jgi:hypothetical protein